MKKLDMATLGVPIIHGWPLVTAKNCFDVAKKCGIIPWKETFPRQTLRSYLASATLKQIKDAENFAPKVFVAHHRDPHKDAPFDVFGVRFKPYSCVMAFISHPEHGLLVASTVEWKGGNNKITIVPVCGVPGPDEADTKDMPKKMLMTASREFLEETGFTLNSLVPLSPDNGLWAIVRNAHVVCYPFLGQIDMNIPQGPTKLDENEQIQMVLFTLPEWMKLIEDPSVFDGHNEFGLEACTRDVTYSALRRMGLLQMNYPQQV